MDFVQLIRYKSFTNQMFFHFCFQTDYRWSMKQIEEKNMSNPKKIAPPPK